MDWTMLGRTVWSSMASVLWRSRSRFVDDSLLDPAKARIVVIGVITNLRLPHRDAAAHDATCSPVAGSGRGYGVFAVVAALSPWQQTFAIAERHAVLGVGKRTAS